MRMMKIITVTCIAVLCATLLFGCNKPKQDIREVATVNGDKVSAGEFKFYLDRTKKAISSDTTLNITDEASWETVEIENQKAIDLARTKALDQAVKIKIQLKKAKDAGITLSSADNSTVQSQKNVFLKEYGGQGGLKTQLDAWGLTEQEFHAICESLVYINKYIEKFIAEDPTVSAVSEEDIQAKYNTYVEEMTSESINVKHILVMFKPKGKPERTQEEALALSQQIIDKINAGQDFEKLMKEYSEDSPESYEGYKFKHNDGQYMPEFDNASYELGVGDVSQPVKTEYGYHIIKKYTPEVTLSTIDELRDSIKNLIQSESYDKVVETWVTQAVIVKNDAVLTSIK